MRKRKEGKINIRPILNKPWIYFCDSLHSDDVHTVNLREDTCTCTGFRFRKNCTHLKLVKKLVKEHEDGKAKPYIL